MILYISFFIFLYGIIIGSFFNVCIHRLPINESVITPRSHCTNCKTLLSGFDLVPIMSYILLGGKCRYCHIPFSIQYLIVELLTGIIFLLLYFQYGLGFLYIFFIGITSILICITFIDYNCKIIPDRLIFLVFLLGLLYRLVLYTLIKEKSIVTNGILGFLLGGGIFLILAIISNGGMGGGDIKLIAMLGICFGWKDIVVISFLSFIVGGIISVFLLIFKIKSLKDPIPFAPFISFGTLILILYKDFIIKLLMI